ncbi:MAG: nucleotide sugar dehydrogenase [Elusimicrobia bacterium]|nr:nucleotide sugar dehydrogenase [Elusimicrobiota bacterium]
MVYTGAVTEVLGAKLKSRTARIGVVGLGYVGLPLAVEFARAGFAVTGIEASRARADALGRGRSYVEDVPGAEVARLLRARRLEIASGGSALSRCDAVVICVQTPLRKSKEPDLGAVAAACREAAKSLRRGQLVVLESTTYPGTTEEVVRPALESSGLKAGRDFFLAYSPERVDPGNATWKIANTPKVVGGIDAASTRLAAALYGAVAARVVPVSSAKAAELVKLLENSFRAVNIALVNEMAQVCDRLGLDVWEVVGAAATKPFGFMPFWPGPGIGGHCIPKDPQLLSWKMKTLNYEPRFIQLATAINGGMPEYAAARVARALNRDGKAVNGSRILVLGVAYKPGVSDCRESPSLDVMHLLAEQGARVEYHDARVPRAEAGGRAWRSRPLTDAALKRTDLVAILTAHRDVDYARVARLARRVFDARNATSGLSGRIDRL